LVPFWRTACPAFSTPAPPRLRRVDWVQRLEHAFRPTALTTDDVLADTLTFGAVRTYKRAACIRVSHAVGADERIANSRVGYPTVRLEGWDRWSLKLLALLKGLLPKGWRGSVDILLHRLIELSRCNLILHSSRKVELHVLLSHCIPVSGKTPFVIETHNTCVRYVSSLFATLIPGHEVMALPQVWLCRTGATRQSQRAGSYGQRPKNTHRYPPFDRTDPPAGSVDRREHRNTPPAYSPRVLYFAGRPTVAELPVFAADCGLPLPIKVGAAIWCYEQPAPLSMRQQWLNKKFGQRKGALPAAITFFSATRGGRPPLSK
jgi:hypothetical protein